jgi:hypothetical protein
MAGTIAPLIRDDTLRRRTLSQYVALHSQRIYLASAIVGLSLCSLPAKGWPPYSAVIDYAM